MYYRSQPQGIDAVDEELTGAIDSRTSGGIRALWARCQALQNCLISLRTLVAVGLLFPVLSSLPFAARAMHSAYCFNVWISVGVEPGNLRSNLPVS